MLATDQSSPNKIKEAITRHLRLFIFFTSLVVISISPVSFSQSNEDCLACHEDNTLTMEKKGKEVSLFVELKVLQSSPHRKLSCVSCHVGFNAEDLPHKENIQPINCMSCHKDARVKHQFHPQMKKANGINGPEGASCKTCHGTHDVSSPKSKNSKWAVGNIIQSCGLCHKDVKEVYISSKHYEAFTSKVAGAPNCLTCHNNALVSKKFNGDTLQIKLAQEKLCLSCHFDDPEIRARTSPSAGFIMAYEKSVHGSSLAGGNAKAATCIDCHTSHGVQDGNQANSSVNRFSIPGTCGKCHDKINLDYQESIHGVSALQKGNRESPVCTDCHGEHNILRIDDPQSPVEFKNVSKQVCAPCHSSVKLSEKYGLSADRFKTFSDSYHGLAIRGGSLEVANCTSCHGAHNIKSHNDPTSTTHKSNLVATCGSCHPGANANFTVGRIHVSLDKEEEPLLYWIAYLYISLIVTLLAGMFLHNLIDFIKKAKIKKLKQVGHIESESHGHALYLRMNLSERIQHATMAISFMILVITGFMLRYPESWWVTHIRQLSEDAFIYRSLLHRIAAVVMVTISLYHIYYISFTERGRQLLKDLLPRYQDILDAIGVAKFNLGISKEKPLLDRFSYIEKAEYWALIWGTIVMTATGFILWFDNTFMGLLTKLGWDAARTIHYYEAWLAFLAIVVWHFYFVIFNPDIYPMNTTWLTGKISEEQMAEEHPKELEKIKLLTAQSEAESSSDDENQTEVKS
jgi:cytochrome b subunit of formate dehydrogenase